MTQPPTSATHAGPSDHDRVGELIELAGTYFVDGAPRTAAMKLRAAADLCDQIADRKVAHFAAKVSL